MAQPNFYIKKGDTSPAIEATLRDGGGAPANIAGAIVVFSMKNERTGALKVNRQAASIVSAPGGVVRYEWAEGDTDTSGRYLGEFEVTYDGGSIETFPNRGYLHVRVFDEVA